MVPILVTPAMFDWMSSEDNRTKGFSLERFAYARTTERQKEGGTLFASAVMRLNVILWKNSVRFALRLGRFTSWLWPGMS